MSKLQIASLQDKVVHLFPKNERGMHVVSVLCPCCPWESPQFQDVFVHNPVIAKPEPVQKTLDRIQRSVDETIIDEMRLRQQRGEN